MTKIRIGCSSFTYKEWIAKAGNQSYFDCVTDEDKKKWIGPFFPRGTKPADLLTVYSQVFDAVEVDSSFYRIPPEDTVNGWFERSPDDFVFTMKMPRDITHFKRMKNCEAILEEFCKRARLLKDKLGAILIQTPPNFTPKALPALEAFLPTLPTDLKFAIEFRDQGWVTDELLAMLKQHKVALALTESDRWPRELSFSLIDRPTTDFAYVRWLGKRVLTDFSHMQIDRDEAVKEWLEQFKKLEKNVKSIFGFFTNHFQGHSPYSAVRFREGLGLKPIKAKKTAGQESLF